MCIHTSITAVIAHPVAIWETPAATLPNATRSSVLSTFTAPLGVKEVLFSPFYRWELRTSWANRRIVTV